MRRYILAIALATSGIKAVQAQRMLPGQKGLEINAGILAGEMTGSYYLNMMCTKNGKNGNYRLWGAEYTHRLAGYRDVQVPLESYTGELGYSFLVLGDAGKNITLQAGITALAGYESINRGKALLYDGATILDKDRFVYGAGGRLSLETYLSDRLVQLLQGRTKVLWGTDLKQFRPSAGAGIRFNF
ncbi:MAG: conjugal transfer protein TraO [Chitinophagaceae bacterium]